jgi:hypothetical protein
VAEASATAAPPDRPTGWQNATWRKILVALALSVLSEIATWVFARGYGYWVLGQPLGLRSFCRWDCFWYGSIVLYGYDAVPSRNPAGDGANWAFYPLFPLLAGLWHRLAGFGFEDSLIITGTLALPVCIYLFIEFVEADEVAVSPWVSGSPSAAGILELAARAESPSGSSASNCGQGPAQADRAWLGAPALVTGCSRGWRCREESFPSFGLPGAPASPT